MSPEQVEPEDYSKIIFTHMSMDKGSELILDLILKKSEGQITEEDRIFLRARRSYVPESELRRLGAFVEEPVPVSASEASAPVVTEPVAPVVTAPVAPVAEETASEKPVAKMNKEELLALAVSRGVAVPEGATNAQLKALLK